MYMLRNILLKILQVILSGIVAFAVDYAFAAVTAEYLQRMPRPLMWIILILLAGGSGTGMYKLLGWVDKRVGGEHW